MLKLGYNATFRNISLNHLHRQMDEFPVRQSNRPSDMIAQMVLMKLAADGERLRFSDPFKGGPACPHQKEL